MRPSFSMSPEKAETESGTSWRDCWRFCAVTTISSRPTTSSAGLGGFFRWRRRLLRERGKRAGQGSGDGHAKDGPVLALHAYSPHSND